MDDKFDELHAHWNVSIALHIKYSYRASAYGLLFMLEPQYYRFDNIYHK